MITLKKIWNMKLNEWKKLIYLKQYYGCIDYEGSLMILMEYCDKGSLRDILDSRKKVLREDQISLILYNLLLDLNLINKKYHIIYRDIKAGNI